MVSRKRIRTFLSDSPAATLRLAEGLARKLKAGAVLALTGEIGSGKTVFIKGLSRGLGVKDSSKVKSPTFVLFHLYEGKIPIYHFDLYRLEKRKELEAIGFEEFLSDRTAVSLIEWADRAGSRIPKNAVWVEIKITGPATRKIILKRPPSSFVLSPQRGERGG